MKRAWTADVRRKLVAWWLLLLLVRVLAPEAAVLRLHRHAHTEREASVTVLNRTPGKALISVKHQHCFVEQFYDAPYQPATPPVVPEPVRLLSYAEYRPEAPVCRAAHLLDGACLRGPPARCA